MSTRRGAQPAPATIAAKLQATLGSPPTALAFGGMAGLIATFTFLPSALPLAWAMISGDEAIGLRRTESAARAASVLLDAGVPPTEEFRQTIDVDILYMPLTQVQIGDAEPLGALLLENCEANEAATASVNGQMWAISCSGGPEPSMVAATRLKPARQAQLVLSIVVALALVVGITTALGVLRLLRPLSDITKALDRVGAGERGVRMPQTGLLELDDLVDRLNAAARDMEDREDTILGRIEVVQEMARMVAHEVRNPLQSLELLTSLIASEDDEAERLSIAASIHEEIRTLETVVHRLLRESATKGALRLQLQPASLAPLVEKVLALRRPQANARGTHLSTDGISTRSLPIDSALLKRSIENLVLNAMQAVADRGGQVRVSVYEEDPNMLLIVDDNGPGVPEDMLERIFEADVTSKKSGTGLGLALVKGVVEAHNGYIRCGSSPLGGARFEIRIPLEAEESSEQAAVENSGGGRQP